MTDQTEPLLPTSPAPDDSNRRTLLIIAGIIVFCCVCAVGTFVFYQYLGDPLLEMLGLQ